MFQSTKTIPTMYTVSYHAVSYYDYGKTIITMSILW